MVGKKTSGSGQRHASQVKSNSNAQLQRNSNANKNMTLGKTAASTTAGYTNTGATLA